MKVLILGGYGVFGGRLAELLSDIPNLELLISGRNLKRAAAFCKTLRRQSKTRALQLDRADIVEGIDREKPDLVVDASGPFQDYGQDRYRVVTSCIAAGVNYLDFADAADFVFGVSQFDEAAKTAGVFVLSGVSSFPVLTAAVLRNMARRMDVISVEGGIAPSPYAGIGLNVMRAVVGYAGSPVKLLRDGRQQTAPGLAESIRFTVAVPGHLPLRNIHFSLVDVPDLQVIPPDHQTMRDIWMGAGPSPEFLHRALNLLAKARATFALPSLVPLSRLFYSVLNTMRFGEHRGGMFVRAKGFKDGKVIEESWHLLAEGDDGPYIPSMAIEAVVRKLIGGIRPATGSRPATHALSLDDYEDLFKGRQIFTGFRRSGGAPAPLYREVLGPAFEHLPEQLKALHDLRMTRRWVGTADVTRGTNFFAKLICRWINFPAAARGVAVQVELSPNGQTEQWTRNFGGAVFSSVQSRGQGRDDYLIVERFGAIRVSLALVIEGDRLYLVPRRWSLFGVPMPSSFLPNGRSFETERGKKFCFDVEISAPVVGLIVAYKGELAVCGGEQAQTN